MATDYWKKREDDWIEECEKDHEKYLKEIKAIYQRMYDELEEQVELFYQRYAENEGITMQEAKKRLTNAEMEKLSRKAKEYCELAALDMRNQNRANEAVYFSEEANTEMAKYNATMRINRLEMLKQYVALSAMKAQANVAGVTREALTEEAMKQHKRLAGILGNTVAGIEGKAKAIAEASFHGQTYSERIWGKNQDELIKRLNKIITDAIIQGKNPDTAIKKMAKDFNVTQQQAKRLVDTELQRVKATVYKNQYKESDFDAYEYHAYAGCCKECQKLDGTKHPLKDLEPGYTAPPMHPNCRCSTTPYVDMSFTEKYSDEDVDDFDEWCEYMEEHEDDPDVLTWKEWKKNKDAERSAKNLIAIAKKKDKTITSDLKSVVEKGSGHLEGLDYRIKSYSSLKRKLITKSASKHLTVKEYASKVTDVLRFTSVSNSDSLVEDFFGIVDGLKSKGYNLIEVTNTLGDSNVAYRGINTLVEDAEGYIFELQFHTNDSLEAKELNHKLYEEQRQDETSIERKYQLTEEMVKNVQSIVTPKDISKIKNIG